MAYLDNYVGGTYIPDAPANSTSEDEEAVNVADKQFTNYAVDFDQSRSSTCTRTVTTDSLDKPISECRKEINTLLKEHTIPAAANNPTTLEVIDLLQKYSSPKEEFFGIFEPRLTAVDVDKLISSYDNPSKLPTPKENLQKYTKITEKKESTATYEKLSAYINQHIVTNMNGRNTKHSYHYLKNKPNILNSFNYAKQVRQLNNIPPQPNTLSYNNADPTRKESKYMHRELGADIYQRDVGGNERENRNSYNSLKNKPIVAKSFNYAKHVGDLVTSDNNTPSQSNMFNYNSTIPIRKESKHMYGKLDPYPKQLDVEEEELVNTNSFNYPKKEGHHNYTSSQCNMFINTNPSTKESKDMYEKFRACINELQFKQNARNTTNSFHYPKNVEKYNNTPPKLNMSNYNNTNSNWKESKDMYEKFGACIDELNFKLNARNIPNSFNYPKEIGQYSNTQPKSNMFTHNNVKPIMEESKGTYGNELNYRRNARDTTNLHNSFNRRYDIRNPFKSRKQQEQPTNNPSRFCADCTNASPIKKESTDKYQILNVFTNQHYNEGKQHLTTTSNISLRNKRFIKNSYKYLKQFEEQNSNIFKSNTLDHTNRDMKNEESAEIYEQIWTYINERIVGGKEPHKSMSYNSLRNDCYARNVYNYLKKMEQPRYASISHEMLDYCRRFVASNIYDRFLIKYNLMKIFSKYSLRNQL